jgi:hypothetical protein
LKSVVVNVMTRAPELENEMLVTKGVSSGERLLKTENCTHETDKGVGKADVYWHRIMVLWYCESARRDAVVWFSVYFQPNMVMVN